MEAFNDASILITGGAGFVGSNLVRRLLAFDVAAIHIVDNLLSAERANVPADGRIRFTQSSITDDSVLAGISDEYDFVFHLCTYHGNQSSLHDPLADHANNTLTTLKLYDWLKHFQRIKRVVYSSAGCTVAEKTFDKAEASTEDAPVSLYLDSPYQISKIIGELYANFYWQQHRLPVVKARFQNVYGPGEILGAGQWRGTPATIWRNVTPTFIYRALKHLPLIIENGGIATRDFIFVDDIVTGLLLGAAKGEAGEVYNLASGGEVSILDLANMINELTGNPTPVELGPKRGWDRSGKRFGSTVKSKAQLGFEASVDIRSGLAQTIAWTQANLALIDGCIRKHAAHLPAEMQARLFGKAEAVS